MTLKGVPPGPLHTGPHCPTPASHHVTWATWFSESKRGRVAAQKSVVIAPETTVSGKTPLQVHLWAFKVGPHLDSTDRCPSNELTDWPDTFQALPSQGLTVLDAHQADPGHFQKVVLAIQPQDWPRLSHQPSSDQPRPQEKALSLQHSHTRPPEEQSGKRSPGHTGLCPDLQQHYFQVIAPDSQDVRYDQNLWVSESK